MGLSATTVWLTEMPFSLHGGTGLVGSPSSIAFAHSKMSLQPLLLPIVNGQLDARVFLQPASPTPSSNGLDSAPPAWHTFATSAAAAAAFPASKAARTAAAAAAARAAAARAAATPASPPAGRAPSTARSMACACRPELVSSSAPFEIASVVSSKANNVPALRASWIEARSCVALAPPHAHATASRAPQKVRCMVVLDSAPAVRGLRPHHSNVRRVMASSASRRTRSRTNRTRAPDTSRAKGWTRSTQLRFCRPPPCGSTRPETSRFRRGPALITRPGARDSATARRASARRPRTARRASARRPHNAQRRVAHDAAA
jgi:hypothetical protein